MFVGKIVLVFKPEGSQSTQKKLCAINEITLSEIFNTYYFSCKLSEAGISRSRASLIIYHYQSFDFAKL